MIVGCSSERPSSALDRVKRSGVLRWGGDIQGGEPYVFEDPKRPDGLTGFEVEIAEALARELGVKAKFVQNDWSTLVPSLERGTFDLALNGLEVTAAREQRIRFTRPYYLFAERLVARAGDGRIRDLASLRGLRVGTLANSLAWDLLGASGAERVPYEGQEEPFLDLAQGRTDAVLLDDIIVARYGNKPGLAVVADVAEGRYGIGVRRGEDDLWAAVDGALGRLARSGALREIFRRWQIDGPRQERLAEQGGDEAHPVGRRRPLDAHQLGLFLQGAAVTVLISASAMLLAILGGLFLAVARLPSPVAWRRPLRWAATAYVEIFRGTPVLLQLFVIYYGLAGVFPLGAYAAAILGLGLNYAAYEAEIYRAGIQAVPRGEIEAAHALGMTGALTLRRVILPQAFRFSLPGVANDFIALLKDSSLVSVITVVELTKRMTIAAVDLGDWAAPGALCALMYFAMSYPLSRLARRLEAHLGGPR
ncbi:MAG TPA: ABC transporter substrate-binding protein/permease [Polyangia bacterium]|nr:ABC transporter substrate-binding protein/permease [Polyangia bacterium]